MYVNYHAGEQRNKGGGGEMENILPANMANACCNPKINASTTGIRASSPKNGAPRCGDFINGRLGVNKKA